MGYRVEPLAVFTLHRNKIGSESLRRDVAQTWKLSDERTGGCATSPPTIGRGNRRQHDGSGMEDELRMTENPYSQQLTSVKARGVTIGQQLRMSPGHFGPRCPGVRTRS